MTPQEANLHLINQFGPCASGSLLDGSWSVEEPGLAFALRTTPDHVLAELVRSCAGNDNPLFIESIARSLLTAGISDPQALDACEAAVKFVGRVRNLEQITPEQRRFFLSQLESLRQTIQVIALEQADLARTAGNKIRAHEIEVQLLQWREALGQRVILEQQMEFAAEPRVQHGVLPPNLQNNWPFPNIPESGLGRLLTESLQGPTEAFSLGCLGVSEEPGTDAPPPSPDKPYPHDPARWKALRDRIAERPLAELIPQGAVWLRALFKDDGSLRWWAIRHEETGTLTVLADGRSLPGTESKLRQANEDFDRVIDAVWSAYQYGQFPIDLKTRHFLGQFASWASRPPEDNGRLLALHDLEGEVRGVLGRLRTCIPLLASRRAARSLRLLANQGDQLLCDALAGRQIELVEANAWVEKVKALRGATETKKRVNTDGKRDEARRNALDSASKDHLQARQEAWKGSSNDSIDLSGLWSVGQSAGIDWQQTDVLFTVQGPLWHAPLAWLNFGGQPLFQCVASTSRVVSLTLRRSAEEDTAVSKCILSAHWLPEIDRRHLLGLPHLHAELRRLGQQTGCQVWGLGYDPAAKVSLLRAALMQHEPRFGVIVVGGHGDARQGVRLADGALFCGPGGLVDLSGLDLLLLVACAVGRVEQTGDCDVEGLYAHLAAHGCRSVIAAGWKIADREAAIFGAEVVRQYLESPAGPFRRARALNKARKTLLNTNNPRVSWHLASAFEIHGRG